MKETLIDVFLTANNDFLSGSTELILSGVNERTLCGEFKDYLKMRLNETPFRTYHSHLDYNRNQRKVKTILDERMVIVTINCDLIVHSMGKNKLKDNLIAIEMKKSTRKKADKEADKRRLRALTKTSYDDVWSADGITLPEHVCGYELGYYYEIHLKKRTAYIEQYYRGTMELSFTLDF